MTEEDFIEWVVCIYSYLNFGFFSFGAFKITKNFDMVQLAAFTFYALHFNSESMKHTIDINKQVQYFLTMLFCYHCCIE